jgi:hypothetical protein
VPGGFCKRSGAGGGVENGFWRVSVEQPDGGQLDRREHTEILGSRASDRIARLHHVITAVTGHRRAPPDGTAAVPLMSTLQ